MFRKLTDEECDYLYGEAMGAYTENTHPDNDAAAMFCNLMQLKLRDARNKGRSGWDDPNWTQEEISKALREHVEKGDPIDVANFCMFLAYRQQGIL